MNEKKLTDEEVITAMEICYTFTGCTNECPYFNKNGRNFCMEDKAFYKDLKDLINRLQAENKGLEDLCNKTYDDLTKEIERLTEELNKAYNSVEKIGRNAHEMLTNLEDENKALQKQVDELKFDKELLQKLIDKREKDTAKEILAKAPTETNADEMFIHWLRERYNVEVDGGVMQNANKDCIRIHLKLYDTMKPKMDEMVFIDKISKLYNLAKSKVFKIIKDIRIEQGKQVNELKERAKIDLENERNWGKIQTKQAIKDTAKEIYGRVLELIPIWGGYQKFIDDFEGWLKERYGVEVE